MSVSWGFRDCRYNRGLRLKKGYTLDDVLSNIEKKNKERNAAVKNLSFSEQLSAMIKGERER